MIETARITIREKIVHQDIIKVRNILQSTGLFYPAEVTIAVNLVAEGCLNNETREYYFLFAESDKHMVGYSCFGPIACTFNRFDLYWIAVNKKLQHSGIGTLLLNKSEEKIAALGGKRIYIDTSSRDIYQQTRRFYEKNGYKKNGEIDRFYSDLDNKIIYMKELGCANYITTLNMGYVLNSLPEKVLSAA